MSVEEIRPVVEMRGIVKHFPGVLALKGVDLDARPAEVHVLLGENGAGKSTLIKVLSGVYPPDSGEILFEGKPVHVRSPHDAQQLGVSTIYQEFNLVPEMSVAENIFLGREPLLNRRLGIVDRKQLFQQAREVLSTFDIQVAPETIVKRLGIAQQQMVEIAKALSLNARVIVMDEPTAVLTAHEINHLFKMIQDFKQRGIAIIYISHRLEEVKRIGDRATILRDGAAVGTVLVASTPVDELIRMMVGRDLKDKFPKLSVEPGEEVLRVENLRRKGVLHGVSFHLRRGEILGVAGLVGSRRTEMARAIFGVDKIDSGHILVRGQRAEIKSPSQAIRARLALVPEDRKRHGILPTISVKHNITLSMIKRFARIGILDLGSEKKAAQGYADSLRIATPNLDRWAMYLSGGNQQKAVIAKWLGVEADIFLFDEPTRGIDVGAKVEVYQLMGELVKRGAAILMISSELPEILGMSDRVIVMREGRIAGEFTRAEANQEKILSCALGGTFNQQTGTGAEA
ncbi:MAG: sugar ABC transporter ATP-binding protein [Candidatus Korobacteraceae bacterium]|jgi:ribose transport system ATP-binding protein